MKYLLDKNLLTSDFKKNVYGRDDLCVLQDVLDEGGFTGSEISKIVSAGVKVLKVGRKHLEKLKEVLASHGANLKLINLYSGKGTADVVMIAFVLGETDRPETLFPEQYSIVTNDKELMSVGKSYGISCISELD